MDQERAKTSSPVTWNQGGAGVDQAVVYKVLVRSRTHRTRCWCSYSLERYRGGKLGAGRWLSPHFTTFSQKYIIGKELKLPHDVIMEFGQCSLHSVFIGNWPIGLLDSLEPPLFSSITSTWCLSSSSSNYLK